MFYCFYMNLTLFKNQYIILLNWVESLPVRDGYLRESWIRHFYKAKNISMLSVKFTLASVVISGISITIIFPLFRYFVNGELFALPTLIHLPLMPATHWPLYLVNLAHQVYSLSFAICWAFATVCFVFTITIHTWFHFEAIKILVGSMAEGIGLEGYQSWLKSISTELDYVKR